MLKNLWLTRRVFQHIHCLAGHQWPFALKAFRKVDVAGVIHDIGHFGTAYSGIYLVLLFVLLIAYV